jgi:hypothetical protein
MVLVFAFALAFSSSPSVQALGADHVTEPSSDGKKKKKGK